MSIIIEINNSLSKVLSSNYEIKKQLKDILSYQNKNIFYLLTQAKKKLTKLSYFTSVSQKLLQNTQRQIKILEKKLIVYLFNLKTSKFPTGLLNLVIQFFNENNIKYKLNDKRIKPEKYLYLVDKYKEPKLRYYQKEALDICLKLDRATIESATASGKTLIMTTLIKELGVNTIIIVPTINILSQTAKILKRRFGSKYIGIIGDTKKNIDKNIIVASVQSLINLEPEYFDKFDCLIIDESHHSSADTYTKLNKKYFTNIYYRFFFSGTQFRNDGSDLSLLGVISTIDYRYSAKQGIKDGFLSAPIFFIVRNQLSHKPIKTSNYATTYREYIVKNTIRNNIIAKHAHNLAQNNKKVLILVDQIKHGDILYKLMPKSTFINSNTRNNDRIIDEFNLGNIPILIGTDVIGEGVDTVGADALIMGCGGKAKSNIIQKVGRVLRLKGGRGYATVIDFLDSGVAPLDRHGAQRISIYNMYESRIEYI